ncbi:LuxR family quorum-sensing system transcriptional regulator CciR, partial [Stakelama sediminis]
MDSLLLTMELIRSLEEVDTIDAMAIVMAQVAARLGFRHFALTHHVDLAAASASAIHIHNYPQDWAEYYHARALGVRDPVHRASQTTNLGFYWSRLSAMIPLTREDHAILAEGKKRGIGDGITIPAHIPGEAHGSCSFANPPGRPMPDRLLLPVIQTIAGAAFARARQLRIARGQIAGRVSPVLTRRQRDCLIWAARGKGDWEISRILGVSEETVAKHFRAACERYG